MVLAHNYKAASDILAYLVLKYDLPVLRLPQKKAALVDNYLSEEHFLSTLQLIDCLKKNTDFIKTLHFRKCDSAILSDYKPPPKAQPEKIRDASPFVTDSKEYFPEQIARDVPRASFGKVDPPFAQIKNTIEEHDLNVKENDNVFKKLGKVWFLKYNIEEFGLFPDNEKYEYIYFLLDLTSTDANTSHGSVYNTELVAKVKKALPIDDEGVVGNNDLNYTDFQNELTHRDIKKFKEVGQSILERLNNANKRNNQDDIKSAEKELSKYQSHLLNEYGIRSWVGKDGGTLNFKRYHRTIKELEKIRQLVKNQINNAIKDFDDSMPAFSRHLKLSIKVKSNETIYMPEQKIKWYLAA